MRLLVALGFATFATEGAFFYGEVMKSTIYALVDPRKKEEYRYVGKTVQKLSQRLSGHVYEAGKPDSHTYKTHWIRKLLREGVKPQIIKLETIDVEIDCEREIYWISRLKKKGYKLTNGTEGGEVAYPGERSHMFGKTGKDATMYGKHHSEKTKRQMSEAHKGEKNAMYGKGDERTGKKNTFYGKKHTEEARRKMSEKLKGHPAHNKGKPMSPETKQKLSAIAKLKTGSKAPQYGKSCSPETRRKIGEAIKRAAANKSKTQRAHSSSTRRKISEALKQSWARKRGKISEKP